MITKEQVIEILKTVKDPEIGIDIYTMGLIYNIETTEKTVKILMTYTTPFCPWGQQLNSEIETAIKDKLKAEKVEIEVTYDPPYQMPEDLRALIGI